MMVMMMMMVSEAEASEVDVLETSTVGFLCAQAAGSGGRAPSGVQGQSPWSWDQWGEAPPPEAERKLNFDNTITRLIHHYI